MDGNAMVSIDGLTLVFTSDREGGVGGFDLYSATRDGPEAAFANVTHLAALSSEWSDAEPYLSSDASEIWFVSERSGQGDIYRASKEDGTFGAPELVAELNSPSIEILPVISDDGLTAYLGSNRDGNFRIWSAHRSKATAEFALPEPVVELNLEAAQTPSWLSPDACRLYFNVGYGEGTFYFAAKPK
jgi:Tol biopolymer transport system component